MKNALEESKILRLITDQDLDDAHRIGLGKWPGLEEEVGDPVAYEMQLREARMKQNEWLHRIAKEESLEFRPPPPLVREAETGESVTEIDSAKIREKYLQELDEKKQRTKRWQDCCFFLR